MQCVATVQLAGSCRPTPAKMACFGAGAGSLSAAATKPLLAMIFPGPDGFHMLTRLTYGLLMKYWLHLVAFGCQFQAFKPWKWNGGLGAPRIISALKCTCYVDSVNRLVPPCLGLPLIFCRFRAWHFRRGHQQRYVNEIKWQIYNNLGI